MRVLFIFLILFSAKSFAEGCPNLSGKFLASDLSREDLGLVGLEITQSTQDGITNYEVTFAIKRTWGISYQTTTYTADGISYKDNYGTEKKAICGDNTFVYSTGDNLGGYTEYRASLNEADKLIWNHKTSRYSPYDGYPRTNTYTFPRVK